MLKVCFIIITCFITIHSTHIWDIFRLLVALSALFQCRKGVEGPDASWVPTHPTSGRYNLSDYFRVGSISKGHSHIWARHSLLSGTHQRKERSLTICQRWRFRWYLGPVSHILHLEHVSTCFYPPPPLPVLGGFSPPPSPPSASLCLGSWKSLKQPKPLKRPNLHMNEYGWEILAASLSAAAAAINQLRVRSLFGVSSCSAAAEMTPASVFSLKS